MNVPGAYRKLVAFPADLSWTFVKAHGNACTENTSAGHSTAKKGSSSADDNVKRPRLVANDCSECEVEHLARSDSETTELTIEMQPGSNNCCSDLEISFSLEPSCYATSCIRELMKN